MFDRWHRHSNAPDVVQRYFETDDGFARQKVQDVEPLIDRNRAIRNDTNGRTEGGGVLIGSIPTTVYHEWIKEWTVQGKIAPGHMDAVNGLLEARLRDSDFSKFRTTDGGI